MQKFDLKKLNNVEVKKQYRVKISNRFAALESNDDNVNINRAQENVGQNIKMSAKDSLVHYELKQHKTWFDEELSNILHRRKQQAKLLWLQNPCQINEDNMGNVRYEASRTFRTKKRE
jgi:hypothetical protein